MVLVCATRRTLTHGEAFSSFESAGVGRGSAVRHRLGRDLLAGLRLSRPSLSHGRIARDLGNRHRLGAPWYRDENEYAIERVPPGRSYSYAFRGVIAHGAIYRIVVDGRAELWRVNDDERRPKRLAAD